MSEGEFGKFNFSGVHIDINRNMTECDVIATSLHELTHQILASSSSVGMSYLQWIIDLLRNAKQCIAFWEQKQL
mgnify:CR=1 FL=1